MNIEKLLSMLESPKADTRFDACEQLRVASHITDEAIAALRRHSMTSNCLDQLMNYLIFIRKS